MLLGAASVELSAHSQKICPEDTLCCRIGWCLKPNLLPGQLQARNSFSAKSYYPQPNYLLGEFVFADGLVVLLMGGGTPCNRQIVANSTLPMMHDLATGQVKTAW